MDSRINDINEQFRQIIRRCLPPETTEALDKKIEEALKMPEKRKFSLLFSGMPRLTGKQTIDFSPEERDALSACRDGFNPAGWSIDRFCRVYLLMQLDPPGGEKEYVARVEELFDAAEVYEQVALYSALPLYRFPDAFRFRTTEGIRTNITDVFDAIALDNPYPSEQLDEAAWNQMVLKAFFMQRPIYRICGLDQRAGATLAGILSDYAHERWAAGRTVSPELWRCVGPFLDEKLVEDIRLLLKGNDPYREEAAVLACSASDDHEALALLQDYPKLAAQVQSGELSWNKIGATLAGGAHPADTAGRP